MKICLVADNVNTKAGLGRMVSSISSELERRGHEVGFILSQGSPENDYLQINFNFSKTSLLGYIKDLYKIRVYLKNFDYAIAYDVRPAGILLYLASIGSVNKIIVHSLGTYSLFLKDAYFKNKLISLVYKKSDYVFLINNFVKRKILESNLKFSFCSNSTLVPVGVNTQRFSKKLAGERLISGKYIISVGAIKERKGQFEILKAFNQIVKDCDDVRYVIVGSQSDSIHYYNKVLKYVEEQGLSEKIIFIENINDDDLINLYSFSEFLVLAPTSTDTYIEGFGMVFLEAALCGKTSIGTLDSGAEAAIEHGNTGLVVSRDIESLARSMHELLVNSVMRERLELAAFTRALTFDWKNVVDLYEMNLNLLKK